jgi:hypothetical protein
MKLNVESLESRDVPAAVYFAMTDTLRAFDGNGQELWSKVPFVNFLGDVDLAAGDVNGDGTVDAIFGAGKGGPPHVRVLNGIDASEMMSYYAYEQAFTGGVYVAGGDTNNDGRAEVITGAGPGAGPHVQVWDAASGQSIQSFYAGPLTYTGGVRVASFGTSYRTELARPELESRPEARKSLFLSFADNAPVELIPGIWQQVANYFAPFNINVTTVQPTGPANTWASVVVGGMGTTSEGWAAGDLQESTRGVAIVNGFFQSTTFANQPAHVFADRIGWNQPVMIARAIAHEAAHLFGADHAADPTSIMYSGLTTGYGTWDALNHAILSMRIGRA